MSYQLTSLLDSVLGTHQKHSHGEFYWLCPFCHHSKPKLAINVAKGAWHCWVCNASGKRLISLFKKLDCSREQIQELSVILQEDIKYILPDTIVQLSLPKEYHPLWKPVDSIDYRNALRYLTNRGITGPDILRYQIGYCNDGLYKNRIIIPSHDELGKLNYFVGRMFYDGDGMKYKNPPVSKNIIGFEMHINWNYPIVLCEGVYDAIAIKRNAIPLLGKTIPPAVLSKLVTQNVQDVYLALDNDALKQTAYIAKELMNDGRNVYVVELNEKDPSEIGFTHMNTLIRNAKPLTFSDLVRLRIST